jgi:hypothetical protein
MVKRDDRDLAAAAPPTCPALDPRVHRGLERVRRVLAEATVSWRPEDDDERAEAREASAAATASVDFLARARWHDAEAEADHALEVCEAWDRTDYRELALLVHEVCALALDLERDAEDLG